MNMTLVHFADYIMQLNMISVNLISSSSFWANTYIMQEVSRDQETKQKLYYYITVQKRL